MKTEADGKAYDDINITPMLDLAYVLLVIFIIMTTASVQGIKVDLPKASDTPSLAKPKTKAITISNEGKIFLDTYPVTLDELEQRLGARPRAKAQEHPAPLLAPLGEAGVDQDPDVARDARLALPQDMHVIADRQILAGCQRQDAQARVFGGGP